jgi:hypothetical protein
MEIEVIVCCSDGSFINVFAFTIYYGAGINVDLARQACSLLVE